MKTKLLALLGFILMCHVAAGQTLEKIKGDRNVTIKQTYIDDFSKLIVDDDFSIEVVYNSKPSVQIETDDNLHEVIQFDVVDGTLSFEKTMRITSKKKLQITVNYGDSLNSIDIKDDGEIRSLTSMELGNVTISAADNSRTYLNINAKNLDFKSSGKSKSRLNISADTVKVELSDNTKLDALVNGKSTSFLMYQRASAAIEGASSNTKIELFNSTNFTGDNFNATMAVATLEDNSDLIITAINTIALAVSGDSEVYLYGTPEITISKFTDSAKLQKKER